MIRCPYCSYEAPTWNEVENHITYVQGFDDPEHRVENGPWPTNT